MKTGASLKAFISILALAAVQAFAQVAPLHIGMTNGVLDEFGHPLKGTSAGAPSIGMPYVPGEVVQILAANSGIFPPDLNGVPHPNNPILHESRIGDGVDPYFGAVAMFSSAAPGRPAGQTVFARVFNKDSLPASSFYGDSQTFAVSTTFNEYFIPSILRTDKPTDSGDPDNDGLINSWEKSLNGDPNNPDSDGDGMADGPEFRAGTELTNDTSLLQMVELVPSPPTDVDVIWDSIDGKSYQVEFKLEDLTDTNTPFAAVSSVIGATGLVSRTTITNALNNPGGHYRVKLIEP